MRSRMQVSRCCCGVSSESIDRAGFAQYSGWFMMWRSADGELDPIEYNLSFPPSLQYGTLDRPAYILAAGGYTGAVTYPITVRTYSTASFHLYCRAVDSSNTPTATDTPQDYDIYLINQVQPYADYIFAHIATGIPRSSLLGPVRWNASLDNWGTAAYRDTPNLASMVNTLVNGGSWTPNSSLIFLFDVLDQYPSATPPGRDIFHVASSNSFDLTW